MRARLEGTTFDDFYRTRSEGLFRYATVVAGPSLAEDACQEAWLRMWRSWGTAEEDRLDAWARQVVRNCCLDRRLARREPCQEAPDGPTLEPQPDELVVRRAEIAAISEYVRRLPSHLREVLWFREVLGMSYAEIAESLDIPVGTVMSRLHAARRKLARKLGR